LDELQEKLILAVKNCCNEDNVAVLFSGGLDSSVLAKIASDFSKVTLYNSGTKSSQDVKFAPMAAESLNLSLKQRIINKKEIPLLAKKVSGINGKSDRLSLGVGIPEYAAMELINENIVLSGLGAEETFVGYNRFQEAVPNYKKVEELRISSYNTIKERDLNRDIPIAKHFGKELKTPFLDADFVKLALSIPAKENVTETERKILLKRIAKNMGVAEFIYERKKKATQYGSGIDKLLR